METIDFNWHITELFGQTTVDAAAAGLRLIDWLATLNDDVTWTTDTHGRIQFQARQPFCILQPTADFINCTIVHNGRGQVVPIYTLFDVDDPLQQQLFSAYLTAR